jgi:hypothetical protein
MFRGRHGPSSQKCSEEESGERLVANLAAEWTRSRPALVLRRARPVLRRALSCFLGAVASGGVERRVPPSPSLSNSRGTPASRVPWGILLSAPAMQTCSALSRFAWPHWIQRPWYRWPPGLRSFPPTNVVHSGCGCPPCGDTCERLHAARQPERTGRAPRCLVAQSSCTR